MAIHDRGTIPIGVTPNITIQTRLARQRTKFDVTVSSVRPARKITLIAILSSISWIVLAEGFFRAFYPQSPVIPFAVKNGVYIRQPGFHDWISTSPVNPLCRNCPRMKLKLDQDGQRMDETGLSISLETKRQTVLFVGASITAGMFSSFANSFPQQFHKLSGGYAAKACTTFVSSTKDLFGLYKKICRNYPSDKVVLQITARDVFGTPDFMFRDNFGLSPITALLSQIPESRYMVKIDDDLSYADYSNLTPEELRDIQDRLSIRPLLYGYSHLFRLIYHGWRRHTGPDIAWPLNADDGALQKDSALASNKTLKWILAIKKLVEEDKRGFAVLLVPTADLARLIVTKKKLPERWTKLLSLLVREQVDVISGFDFLMSKNEWEPYYYSNDLHPTDLGYQELAKTLVHHFEGKQ